MTKTELEVKCYNYVIRALHETITADFTIGRNDYNKDNEGGHLEPYTQERIDEFICSHEEVIKEVAKTIIQEYKEDDELELLFDEKQMSRVREYWPSEEDAGLANDYYLR